MNGGCDCSLIKRAEIVEGGVEQLLLMVSEIPGSFKGDHFQ